MRTLTLLSLGAPAALAAYAYVFYPVCLKLLTLVRRPHVPPAGPPRKWPRISIVIPAYNEERNIRDALESILSLDYPSECRQILVVSDASTDATDEIVREFAQRGVELLRMPRRVGKTAAETAAAGHLTGEIVINTDASVRIHPAALKALVIQFQDPKVGLASGRDVSVAGRKPAIAGESRYVGYEMWVRRLETQVHGIVGASGCLYAIRRELHDTNLPSHLSRDFAAALIAREQGFRPVAVDDAVCFVPRTGSLRDEYRRKVRTMTRGLQTLFFKPRLLHPLRYGVFAWMLFSHKLCRWLVPAVTVLGLGGFLVGATVELRATWAFVAAAVVAGLVLCIWRWPPHRVPPRLLAFPAYVVAGNLAALESWIHTLRGDRSPTWEPTHREPFRAR